MGEDIPNIKFRKNEYGFYEIVDKPSEVELKEYYKEKYYQAEKGLYRLSYSSDELKYFEVKDSQKIRILSKLGDFDNGKLLDIGCGEGFTLSHFKAWGWEVKGLDFSDFGSAKMNPDQVENIIVGDIYESLKELEQNDEKFDVIIMNNLLEHVIDPKKIMIQCRALLNSNGVLIIQVPNDFSFFQLYLKERKYVNTEFWIAYPDHINYFTRNSLKAFAEAFGWKESYVLSEFPIDIFLANDHSNYIKKPDTGKAAHNVRVQLTNLFHDNDPDASIEMFSKMAELGFGRQIIGFFEKRKFEI